MSENKKLIKMFFDSNEELYFNMFLSELLKSGFVKDFYRSETFILSEKVKKNNKKLLFEHVYTPDFTIEWAEKAKNIFFTCIDDYNPKIFFVADENYKSFVEVKPCFDQNNMTRLFSINQKWMFEKYNIFVNKVIKEKLFEKTFTPKEFLKTASGKERKITKIKVRSLEDFICSFTFTK